MPRAGAADEIAVRAKPVTCRAGAEEQARVGRLECRGGLELSSSDQRFGGLSGLLVSADGRRLVAVSDRGYLIELGLAYDGEGRLTGIGEGTIEPLRGPKGGSLAGLPGGNAEALARGARDSRDGAGTGAAPTIIAFEGRPRLLSYPAKGGPPTPLPSPPGLDMAPPNEGIEALTRLPNGRLLALTEGLRDGGGLAGWLGGPAGWSRLVWRTDAGFRPTGAATLPNGGVLVLERRILPPAARIRLLAAEDIQSKATLDGKEIARFEGTVTFDNMEGIDTRQSENGETLVFVVSDDNYSFLQRTLLLMFRLVD
jgi:hypothetical protein